MFMHCICSASLPKRIGLTMLTYIHSPYSCEQCHCFPWECSHMERLQDQAHIFCGLIICSRCTEWHYNFPFVNWTIFQGYLQNVQYVLSRTWLTLPWETLALENLQTTMPNSIYLQAPGFSCCLYLKWKNVFPVPPSFSLGIRLFCINWVWHLSG